MSLMNCPECGHEVSNEAVACPGCGRPVVAPTPTFQRNVVIADTERNEFPKWLFIPIIIVGALVVFFMIVLLKNNDNEEANRRVNVNVSAPQKTTDSRETTRTESVPNQVEIPSSSTTVNQPTTTTVPQTTTRVPQTSQSSSQTDVPSVPNDKGAVVIDAKISTKTGAVQSVKNEKFYLLDKDLENILSEADLEPIEGQSLSNSFGLAVLYPNRYSDFQRDALSAIKKHIKYNATTDSGGKASMRDVKPNSYYLFGITKTRTGFAIWSSPVSIIGGENKLNLQPATLNEMSE